MKNIILFLILASLCGCNSSDNTDPVVIDLDGGKIVAEDPRGILLYDFRQATKYTQFTDEDYETGHFNYWFYKEEDFLNVSISGVTDEKIINGALEDFKSVMKKRNVEMPIKVYIYEKTSKTSDTTASSQGLIKQFEINEF
ncbi:hypothetical protein P4B35_23665 [Pontiellaceae bacterium B12227]|nr:hypothetical protein [Pontiellaceae bacterium B12227]